MFLSNSASRRTFQAAFNHGANATTYSRNATIITKPVVEELSRAEQAEIAAQRRKERVLIPLVFRGNFQ